MYMHMHMQACAMRVYTDGRHPGNVLRIMKVHTLFTHLQRHAQLHLVDQPRTPHPIDKSINSLLLGTNAPALLAMAIILLQVHGHVTPRPF